MTQTKTCLHCSGSFEITQADLDFYNKISPTFAGEKFPIPTPTLCPDCRQRRRLSFRNERRLYKRKCDASGKDIISIYVPWSDYVVYDQKIRWSDDRDPMKYGRDFDFTRSFTEQFGELMRVVPRLCAWTFNSVNSNFTNFCMNSSDCYMVFSCLDSHNCLYWRNIRRCNMVVDCLQIIDSSYCYWVTIASNCFNVQNSYHAFDCSNSEYLRYCQNCQNCYGCENLENKQYCINNIQYSKEEYMEKINQEKQNNIWVNMIQKMYQSKFSYLDSAMHLINNENDCSYDFIRNSKNIRNSYNISCGENLSYCMEVEKSQDCYDCTFWSTDSMMYEATAMWVESSHSAFFITMTWWYWIYYCDTCVYSSRCFWCIGLRNKQYCIFNKQYTKEDYEIMVWKIIRHMQTTGERWEFFHPSLSPFWYNETVAQEYYPMEYDWINLSVLGYSAESSSLDYQERQSSGWITWFVPPDKEGGRSGATDGRFVQRNIFGYHRSTYVAPTPQVDKVIKWQDVPDTIDDVPDDILKMAVLCEVSNKPFRITPQELSFYRKHHIPLPRKHPDVRHEERMKLRR
jgi:hypothetical protein